MNNGKFDNRAQLVAAVETLYKSGLPLREVAAKCGVSVRKVRHLITTYRWKRNVRPVEVEPRPKDIPMSIPPSQLKLVPDPCLREYCEDQGCPWHYARVG